MDVEHHDTYSYAGITCLIQISSRNCDYIIDVLKFLKHRTTKPTLATDTDTTGGLSKLNVLFTDPNKVKILHGCKRDVEWLQKDIGL